ncbi:peptidoglycan editing factor PgeF [Porphyrobacter sp. GA68]|uniref:peptidoglycan editing factor PgeF n=1 Tax=Porphyrobacter sp. GA68 TaxID=2883480 RepID=UPI001D193CF1|nr:peptidoglycan editing factor PgeF [Porphyrobacter sp. GA68]
MADALPCVQTDVLAQTPHGFFGRFAGEQGANDGMPRYRRAVVEKLMPGAALVMLRQTHSAICVCVAEPWRHEDRPEGDALVTRGRGVVLGLVTADCAPVLLTDRQAGVIGAAHAGWRGALGGVLENTVEKMEELGAARGRIVAAIGPAIAQASYEVDEAFRSGFPADAARFFTVGRPGHFQFDLAGYVANRLQCAGVGGVANLALDTYAQPALFHSYRRARQQGGATDGRQISAIALPARA